jgi:hypothetical protein
VKVETPSLRTRATKGDTTTRRRQPLPLRHWLDRLEDSSTPSARHRHRLQLGEAEVPRGEEDATIGDVSLVRQGAPPSTACAHPDYEVAGAVTATIAIASRPETTRLAVLGRAS